MHEKILSPLMVRTLAYTKEQPVGDGNLTVAITIYGWQMYDPQMVRCHRFSLQMIACMI